MARKETEIRESGTTRKTTVDRHTDRIIVPGARSIEEANRILAKHGKPPLDPAKTRIEWR